MPTLAPTLALPADAFDAYIFDCDGTLADSMPAHYHAWTDTLSRLDLPFISYAEYCRHGGYPPRMLADLLRQHSGPPLDPRTVTREKQAAYLANLPAIRPIAPIVDIARTAAARRRPLAVASTSSREVVIKTLAAIGLAEVFPVIIGGDDVEYRKPAPDCYLLAARRLDIPPARCLAFEDSEAGQEAATRAGMTVMRVPPAPPAAPS
ncbi:MAG: HAD family phosphatase [Opitutaceae bacterium]|jgi:HAD superfamily hydrolase (TIGR01509 family)|nr:HAD family phosphatase [Opitutaceae bacterium]